HQADNLSGMIFSLACQCAILSHSGIRWIVDIEQRCQSGLASRGTRFCEIDVGGSAVTPAERHLDDLSLHQSPAGISQSPARQPLSVTIATPDGATVLVCVMACAGLALTIVAFYPGYLTRDATFIRGYVQTWYLGDWQSPLMTIVWWLIDPIAPGT